MKRAPELRGLSDDHHGALVLAKRAREAAAGGNPDSVEALWTTLQAAYEADLAPHFAIEEAHLVPLLRTVDGSAPLIRRLEDDHAALRVAIIGGPFDARTLDTLGARLHARVRFEERELFPFAERHLGQDALHRVAQAHAAMVPDHRSGQGTG